jgi:hypothetical protein
MDLVAFCREAYVSACAKDYLHHKQGELKEANEQQLRVLLDATAEHVLRFCWHNIARAAEQKM